MEGKDERISPPVETGTGGLMLALETLYRWRKFFLINVVGATLLAVLISFLLPKWYKATVSILPPKQPDIFGAVGSASSVLKNLSSVARLGNLGQNSSAYNYFAILKSRSASEAVIRKFDLMKVYNVSDTLMSKAIKELEDNVSFEDQTDDNINIEVLDKDPVRAAAMANFYVDLLNEISVRLGTQEARSNREFVEQRLGDSRKSLGAAEDALRVYQEKSGMMITPEETATTSAVASLYGLKARREVEVAILRRTVSGDNSALLQAELELNELDKKIATIPGVGLESVRLYRDVAIDEKIVEFLVPLYEQARIEEQKDIPVILVLDRAIPPDRKAKPQRVLIVASVFFLGLVLFATMVFAMEAIRKWPDVPGPLAKGMSRSVETIVRIYRLKI